MKLSGNECNGCCAFIPPGYKETESKSIKTNIICFMTTTITTQAHSHKKENSIAANTKIPGIN